MRKTGSVRGGVVTTEGSGCIVCGARDKLLRCARCREAVYCGKQHQREDWSRHKRRCRALSGADRPTLTSEGSSENEILMACAQTLSAATVMPEYLTTTRARRRRQPEVSLPPYVHSTLGDTDDPFLEICETVVADMNQYGLCVLDDFLGPEQGGLVRCEVLNMYSAGIFQDGQLVSTKARTESKSIRGDQITWIDGKGAQCVQIGQLIQKVDNIIIRANRMSNNGKMGEFTINGRTKAMVACYPGSGSHYVKHVDNPNKDGRCITAIYYLNLDWDVATSGGLLRIFPQGWADQVADIAPVFDRILFFWSDRRNPHEVQPAYKTRYAITLWYFDKEEREEATRRHSEKQQLAASSSSNNQNHSQPT